MPKIIYIDINGKRHECKVVNGLSVMEGAIENSIPGIVAVCGGNCQCSTCHCYIDDDWKDALGPPGAKESLVLDNAIERRETSRLSCQLEVTDALDGLVVHVADNQG
jgi:2Fe-2S ferredoxin